MKPEIKAAFDAIEPDKRAVLLAMREVVFDVASDLDVPVEECLKWGQPSYLAPKGSTLRLGVSKAGRPAIFAHCQSSVISDFASQFGADFEVEGNRAVYLDGGAQADKLVLLIRHGLTYKSAR